MHAPAFVVSIPPIATTGMSTASTIPARPSRPIGGSASGFDGVSQIGPAPMYAAPARSPAIAWPTSHADSPSFSPAPSARSAPSSSRPRWTPSASSRIAAVDVVVDDEHRVELAKRSPDLDELPRRRALDAQLDHGGAARDGRARRLEVLDERVQPHAILARSSSDSGVNA